MFDSAAPDHANPAPAPGPDLGVDPGLAFQLPADAYWQLIHTLRLILPPPPAKAGVTANPDDLARRDRAAIARIAALAPANAAEADVAAQFVAASEQWKDCLRLAQLPETTSEWAAKCRSQALAMMRQANGAVRLLLRMQATRRKIEADDATRDRVAWTEHCAIGLMAEALSHCPAPVRPPPAPLPERAGERATPPLREGGGEGERADAHDLVAAAERYAAAYPERAAAIRCTGRLPADVVYFCPPEAALASVLVNGQTPALAALDRGGPKARA